MLVLEPDDDPPPPDPPCGTCGHPTSQHEHRLFGPDRCDQCVDWGGPCA